MKIIFSSLVCLAFHFLFTQDLPAYIIYTKKGKKTSYSKMKKELLTKKLVFFGELHDNPIAHWLEYEILKELHNKHQNNLICGSEMYERDNQDALNKYISGVYTEKKFKDSCRLWSNYKTDYQPLLDYIKNGHDSTITKTWVATNIPRKYASLVFKKGLKSLDSLSIKEKNWMCPLPFPVDTTLSQYASLLNGELHMGNNFVYAQAIKDATMGYFISKSLKENSVFYHINGCFHSDFTQGILWYVNYYSKIPLDQMITISVVTQSNISKLDKEFLGKADYIISIPETMTKTY